MGALDSAFAASTDQTVKNSQTYVAHIISQSLSSGCADDTTATTKVVVPVFICHATLISYVPSSSGQKQQERSLSALGGFLHMEYLVSRVWTAPKTRSWHQTTHTGNLMGWIFGWHWLRYAPLCYPCFLHLSITTRMRMASYPILMTWNPLVVNVGSPWQDPVSCHESRSTPSRLARRPSLPLTPRSLHCMLLVQTLRTCPPLQNLWRWCSDILSSFGSWPMMALSLIWSEIWGIW